MGSSYHCFRVNRPIYKVYNMTIPIKLRDPNTKVETKQKILINMDVPIWTVEDDLSWVRRNGFSAFADEFKKCEVDGDLLLSLDENDLKDDLRIDNGITRKRFIRELNNLKKNADYSCKDKSGVAAFLSSIDHKCYSYNLIKAQMDPQYMKKLNASDLDDMLKNDARISSKFHRHQIIEACHHDNTGNGNNLNHYPSVITQDVDAGQQDHYDVYLTYAGSNHGSDQLASLLAIELQLRGFRVFNPSEKQMLDSDYSQEKLVKKCKNLVVVLGPGALDGCISDHHSKDPLHRVIKSALHEKNLKIIPVTVSDFQFPDLEELPEDMRGFVTMNAVRWVHDYQPACVEKLERFIRGEAFLKVSLGVNGSGCRTPNFSGNGSYISSNYSYPRSRSDSGRSSPSRLTPLKTYSRMDSTDSAIVTSP